MSKHPVWHWFSQDNLFDLANQVVEFLAPRYCLICSQPVAQAFVSAAGTDLLQHSGLCRQCLNALPGTNRPRCKVCAIEHDQPSAICPDCHSSPPAFTKTLVLADYAPPVDQLIHQLKYRQRLGAARAMGCLLASRVKSLPTPALPTMLIPVPLTASRLRQRGFNQSVQIGRVLASELGISLHNGVLIRINRAGLQTGKSRHQRITGLSASNYQTTRTLEGERIAVIDDVMTSGATLRASAQALSQAGAASIMNLVVARTQAPANRNQAPTQLPTNQASQ